jgi:DNA-binding helix-hairpin-helix protein with protein kinase domain
MTPTPLLKKTSLQSLAKRSSKNLARQQFYTPGVALMIKYRGKVSHLLIPSITAVRNTLHDVMNSDFKRQGDVSEAHFRSFFASLL